MKLDVRQPLAPAVELVSFSPMKLQNNAAPDAARVTGGGKKEKRGHGAAVLQWRLETDGSAERWRISSVSPTRSSSRGRGRLRRASLHERRHPPEAARGSRIKCALGRAAPRPADRKKKEKKR